MATKLSDSEFAERARAGNRQRADRRRGRLAQSGYQQLLVWMPADLRNQIDRVATERATTVTEATALIVRAGLAALAEPHRPASNMEASPEPEPAHLVAEPADTGAFNQDLDAFKSAVADCWNSGMKGYGPIATALNSAGFRNGNGNPYPRSHVKAVLVKAGLVAETGKATKENELDHGNQLRN